MADFTEALGLERNLVRTLALSHIGHAVAQQRERSLLVENLADKGTLRTSFVTTADRSNLDDLQVLAASGVMIGASLLSLLYPRVATVLFRAAAQSYEELGTSYSAVLGLCGRDEGLVERYWRRIVELPLENDEGVASAVSRLLLAMAKATSEEVGGLESAVRVINEAERLRGLPIGSVGIPAQIYQELAGELVRRRLDPAGKSIGRPHVLLRLFEAFEERVQAARANETQWQYLHTSLLPVEPEILAGAIALVEAEQHHGLPLDELVETRRLSSMARIPLDIAREVVSRQSWTSDEMEVVHESEALTELWGRFSGGDPNHRHRRGR